MAAVDSPNSTVQSVHISAPLTDFSLGYHPMGFVADQLFPVVPVKKRNDLYYKWDKGQAFRLERADGYGTMRADGGRAHQEKFGATTDGYVAFEWAMETVITDEEESNADTALQLAQSRIRRAQDKILLDYELRVATIATTAGNFTNGNAVTNAGTTQWNNSGFSSLGTSGSGHSLIAAQLLTGIDTIRKNTGGLVPNVMVVPFSVAMVMANDPGLVDLKKYVSNLMAGDVFANLVPPMYMGMKILIPTVGYITSVEGVSVGALTDVWGKNVVLAHVEQSPSLDSLTFGYTIRSRPWQVKTFRDEFTDSTVHRASFVQTEKLISQDCAYLIAAAIA